MITKCPECNSEGKLDNKLSGKQVHCPQCGSDFIAQATQQTKWYYATNGDNKVGPVTQSQFDSLISDTTIVSDTLVWCKGMDGWQYLSEINKPVPPKKWYYATDGNKIGPITQEQFDSFTDNGTIAPDTLVWCKGMADWQTLSALQIGASKNSSATGRATTRPGLRYGNLIIRFMAKIIDLTFMLAVGGTIEGLSRKLFPGTYATATLSPVAMATLLTNMMLGIFYITWFVGKFGATPGKMVVKLKITNPAGGKIGYGHAFGRYCGEYIAILGAIACLTGILFFTASNFLPFDQALTSISGAILITFFIVYAPALFDHQRRTLYDRFCNTRVLAA